MKKYFSEEHFMLKQMVKEFAEKEIKPIAREIDSKSKFPSEIINKMSALGLLGIPKVASPMISVTFENVIKPLGLLEV